MLQLASPFQICGRLKELVGQGRVRALYVDAGDEWAPLSVERRLNAEGMRTTVVNGDEVRHAFSCNSNDLRRVAAWVSSELDDGS